MDKWLLFVFILVIIASFFAIASRVNGRIKTKRIEEGELSADDFEILD